MKAVPECHLTCTPLFASLFTLAGSNRYHIYIPYIEAQDTLDHHGGL